MIETIWEGEIHHHFDDEKTVQATIKIEWRGDVVKAISISFEGYQTKTSVEEDAVALFEVDDTGDPCLLAWTDLRREEPEKISFKNVRFRFSPEEMYEILASRLNALDELRFYEKQGGPRDHWDN